MKNPRKRLLPWGIGRAIDSIQKVDERGLFYTMDYKKADYYKLEKYAELIANAKPGCSSFAVKNENGDALFGRNYDFNHYRYNKRSEDPKDNTALIVFVRTANPKAKYKTIGMVDGFWFDFKKGGWFEGTLSDGKTNITNIAMAPFVIMDGMNEMGLATSIMYLSTETIWNEVEYKDPSTLTEQEKKDAFIYDKAGQVPDRLELKAKHNCYCINTADKKTWIADKNLSTHQSDPNKKTLMHPILMRRMLDYCKDVDEAIEMAKSYNIKSPMPDSDYHIMLADASGKSVILEWVNNELKVEECKHGTNFYITREDHYGYGKDRDDILKKTLDKNPTLSESKAMDLLEEVSQNPFLKKYPGCTEWSAVYNLNKKTLDLSIFLDYSKQYQYKI